MATFLLVCVIFAAIGAVIALVRGIVVFLQTSKADLMGGEGPSVSGLRQNKMMQARIGFQALAVIFVILFLLISRSR